MFGATILLLYRFFAVHVDLSYLYVVCRGAALFCSAMGVTVRLSTRQKHYVAGDVIEGIVNLTVAKVTTYITAVQQYL